MTEYIPTARSRVKRYHELASYEKAVIHQILDAGLIAHIGYHIDNLPYVTPTAYWRDGEQLFWHGSSASRMLRAQTKCIPVCFTVSHLDGLVLARSGLMHSINYRSVMIFGQANPVDAHDKKMRLNQFIDRLYPGRSKEVRSSTELDLKATQILSMRIDEASAKISNENEPTEDCESDYQYPCWAGVIPIRTVTLPPIQSKRQDHSSTRPPKYLTNFDNSPSLDEVLIQHANFKKGLN